MRTILVTGARGYVGGRLARHFAAAGWRVLSAGRRAPERPEPSGIETIVAEDVAAAPLDFSSIDTVVHLGTANEVACNRDVAAAFGANAVSTYRLLERCLAGGVRHFIYFSTVHVYRTPLTGAFPEDIVPEPAQPYGVAHRAAEDFTRAAAAAGRLRCTVVRLSNAVGAPATPVSRWTLVANDLCRQAVLERALTLKTDGRQWRNFISLGDVGGAIQHLAEGSTAAPGFSLYNLAGTESTRVIDLARLIADRCVSVLGFAPPIRRPAPNSSAPPPSLEIPVAKLLGTGFRFRVPLCDEIDGLLRYCVAQTVA